MFADTEPVRVITTSASARRLLATGVPPVAVDAAAPYRHAAKPVSAADRGGPLLADHAAYVVFTAGSADRPLGVTVSHSAVVNYLSWAAHTYPTARSSTVVGTPLSFDITVTGLFVPLLAGGRVRLGELADQSERPAFLKGSPGHVALLNVLPEDCSPAGHLVLAGAWAPDDELRAWRARHPGVAVTHEYGSVETTVGCLSATEPFDESTPPLLGEPVWNTRAYVLDDRLAPAPLGSAGELYVGGAAVARGYAGRPAATAERFVADPFGPPGSRLHRTGDLVRRDEAGRLVFVGRADDQIQVRGFRIAPGEVEAAITRHSGVLAAAVVRREDQLVGYVVPAGESTVDGAALAEFVATLVPDHAVPSAFVSLPELPTVRGRLNRAALPAPAAGGAAEGAPPRNPTEELVCSVIADVLGVPRIGVDRNFFEAGMDSMKSVRVVSQVRKAGLDIGIADLFAHQTVAALAVGRALPDRSGAGAMADALAGLDPGDLDPFAVLLPIQPKGELPPLFCLHSGVGFSLPYFGLVPHLGPDQPIYGIQAPCVVGGAALPESVEALAAEYVDIIRSVRPTGPYHLLGWSFGGTLAYEMAVRLRAAGEQVGLLSILDAYPRFGVADERGRQDMFAWMLRGIGHDRAELPDRDLTIEDMFEVLRRDDNPMAAMGERRMTAMAELMRHHQVLKTRYAPGRFDGPMQLFVSESPLAGDKHTGEGHTAKARLWDPYFDGPMEVHDVACGHDHMMNPGPLDVIGPKVADALGRHRDGGAA
jgi:thioesterase domain-containing protein/acyl-coenzyme A synthetase/AMP-(fatty) acid ligase/aryl carrier-like protein